jgi:hypothetical protein
MSYGTIKVDTITFTDNSVDKSVSLSGLIQNPTFTGNITVTGTISGDVIRGGTTVSGATVTGTTANFVSGVFTTQISGATVTGTTVLATTGAFTSLTGTTTQGTTATYTTGSFTSLTGTTIQGTTATYTTGSFTSLTGTTIQGTTATYTTGSFTSLTGTTVTGTTASFTSGVFTNISGTTATITSGIIASGTAAAPSLAILADLDTGLFSPGANELAVATNGVGRLFVDSTGKVGIGSPSSLNSFEINTAGTPLSVNSTNGGQNKIILRTNGAAEGYFGTTSTALLTASDGSGSERLRITSAGLVGIGTSSPGDKVHIEGAGQQRIRIRNTTEGSNPSPQSSFIAFRGYYNVVLAQIEVQDRSSSNFGGWINVSTSNSSNVLTNAIHIDSSQRVGIGTTSPAANYWTWRQFSSFCGSTLLTGLMVNVEFSAQLWQINSCR